MIPFLDLKSQYRSIKEEIDRAIQGVLASTEFVLGSEVAAFEKEFAEYSGASFGIGTNSGTSALHLALLAAGVGPGDEVITVPYTFVATVAAIGYTGATPVFVDILPESFNMDPAQIDSKITRKTKVLLPVHLYGQPADMDPILDIAKRHNLVVIEDAAQAHGAEYNGRRVGSIGHMGCFSFYPSKNLSAFGEGGMVTTNDPGFTRTIRMLRDWGQEKKYHHVLKGYNYRLEGLQGAILRVKLRYLEQWTEARRAHANTYTALLRESGVGTPTVMSYARHVFNVYALQIPQRDILHEALQSQGIHTGIHYSVPIHLLEAWSDLGFKVGSFPHAEKAAAHQLSLPVYPELTAQEIQTVAESVNAFMTDYANCGPVPQR